MRCPICSSEDVVVYEGGKFATHNCKGCGYIGPFVVDEKKIQIVVVGAGFGGLNAVKEIKKTIPLANVVLISETKYFLYTPSLVDYVTGKKEAEKVRIDILGGLEKQKISFIEGTLKDIDTKRRIVKTQKNTVPYDYLILALGSQTNYYANKRFANSTHTIKNWDDCQILKKRLEKPVQSLTVVGAGISGIQAASHIGSYLKEKNPNVRLTIINTQETFMQNFPSKAQSKVEMHLRSLGYKIYNKSKVDDITDTEVMLDSKKRIKSDITLWCTGIQPNEIIAQLPLLKRNGGILIDDTLQCIGERSIFAIGDNVVFEETALEQKFARKATTAIKMAKLVAYNIKALLKGIHLEGFKPEEEMYLIHLSQNPVLIYKNYVFESSLLSTVYSLVEHKNTHYYQTTKVHNEKKRPVQPK